MELPSRWTWEPVRPVVNDGADGYDGPFTVKGCAMTKAKFATPAKGLIIPSAEGRRLGPSVRLIPTPERLKRALDALTNPSGRK